MLILVGLLICSPGIVVAEWNVFDPIRDVAPPRVHHPDWSGPIDAFVYRRLVEAELEPAPPVNRRIWLRRVTYDLIGLPPKPEDVQQLLSDSRSDKDAMTEVVKRLLASPRYGEKWARHWLDVVRYADTDGFAIDEERLWLWRYRDYVIRTFNEDGPFDQFIREQIAGDELNSGEPGESDRGKVATSYYRLGPWEADNMTAENRRQDYLNDVTSNVGSAFLGLTVGCARCHDHRFDPITQEDFYRLQAFFTPLQPATLTADYLRGENHAALRRGLHEAAAQRLRKIEELRAKLKKKVAEDRKVSVSEISDADLEDAISETKQPITEADVAKLKELQSDKKQLSPEQRYESKVVAIRNPQAEETYKDTYLLNNGDPFDPGEKVSPGFLSEVPVWSQYLLDQGRNSANSPGGRRSILAAWLTDESNPITPRVLVNRIWQYHFGTGIVATPNDFGENGSGPSHPRLLDYLAKKLIGDGWHLKPLHRAIVLSRAYRTSAFHPNVGRCATVDPANRLLWRASFRRLQSEEIRDAVLAVSGRLRFETGGPGFFEALPTGMDSSYSFFNWEPSTELQRRRRSIYMFQRRNLVHPMMETFDGADLNVSCERRGNSVTAPQALSLLNSQFAHENAGHLARRLAELNGDATDRIKRLFWVAVSRGPSDVELESCLAFLKEKRRAYKESLSATKEDNKTRCNAAVSSLRDLSLAIMNTNEFLYLD